MKKQMKMLLSLMLAVAMLVSTPLSALAYEGGLNSVFDVKRPGETSDPDNGSGTDTTTFTNTNTNTTVLGDNGEAKNIVGIVLNQETVNLEVGTSKNQTELTVTVLYSDGSAGMPNDTVSKMLKWTKTGFNDAELKESDRAQYGKTGDDGKAVAITFPQNRTTNETLLVQAKKGGKATITVGIDANPDGTRDGVLDYFAQATVNVKEYSTKIWFDTNRDGVDNDSSAEYGQSDGLYLKKTYDFGAELARDPETANDEVTYSTYFLKSNGDKADAKKYVSIDKNGVATMKKSFGGKDAKTSDPDAVYVRAITEKGKQASAKVTSVGKGVNITALSDNPANPAPYGKNKLKINLDLGYAKNQQETADPVTSMKVSLQYKTKAGGKTWFKTLNGSDNETEDGKKSFTTDGIEWTSKNAAIAWVEPSEDGMSATIFAGDKLGKTTITATTTNNKKVNYTVTVKATLNDIEKVVDNEGQESGSMYVGQTKQLTAVKNPAQSTTAVKWEIVVDEERDYDGNGKVDRKDRNYAKNIAKVNKKGLVTAGKKNTGTVTVRAYYDTKLPSLIDEENPKGTVAATYELTVNPSAITNVKGISKDGETLAGNHVEKVYVSPNVKSVDFDIVADTLEDFAGDDDDVQAMASWKTAKVKSVSVDQEGIVKALAAGKNVKITASAVNNKGQNKSKTVKVTAVQPVTSLVMAKNVVNVNYANNKSKGNKDYTTTLQVKTQLPKAATKEFITWTKVSGDPEITIADNPDSKVAKNLSKSAKMKVTIDKAAQPGVSAVIKATSTSGATAYVTVTLTKETERVQFVNDGEAVGNATLELSVGESLDNALNDMVEIKARKKTTGAKEELFVPLNDAEEAGMESTVAYTMSKKGIVTIDADGNVYAVKKGNVTITAKTPNGKKATLKIKVID